MVSSSFRVESDSSSASLAVTLPKGPLMYARQDAFLASSARVRSRKAGKKQPIPLQTFWSESGDDNVVWLSLPFNCSIRLIERTASDAPLFVRPSAILALQDTVLLRRPSCWDTLVEATGSGVIAIAASGSVLKLNAEMEFGQVATSKLLAATGVAGADKALQKPVGITKFAGKGTVYVAGVMGKVMPANAGGVGTGISVSSWWALSSQIFFFFLFVLLVGVFGDSLADWFGLEGLSERFQEWSAQFM